MQKFSMFDLQSPSGQQSNCRGLDCIECSSFSSKCRKRFVLLCIQPFCRYSCDSHRGLLLWKSIRETGASPRALEQLVGWTPCLSINKWLQAKFFPNPNPPHHWSEVAPNEHRCPITPPLLINSWLQAKSWSWAHQFTDTCSHTLIVNHISGVEWRQFSSATRLGACRCLSHLPKEGSNDQLLQT